MTVGVLVWVGLALLVAVFVGRGIRIADERTLPGSSALCDVPSMSAGGRSHVGAPVGSRERRPIGLTGIGVTLAAVGVTLEAAGLVARLLGATGMTGRLLSMDGPASLPRLYVTALFATAAVVAVVGAARLPERRAWWCAVAGVAAVVAGIKGGVVHGSALSSLSKAVTFEGAVALSVVLAAAAVAGLWWLSRSERRDRARVLGALSLYAVASVGLSAVSLAGMGVFGATSSWVASATFVEEAVEAVAAVAFFAAVLVGVAPQVALPSDWELRRQQDRARPSVQPLSPPAGSAADAGRH